MRNLQHRTVTAEDFDALMDVYADDAALVVKPGKMIVTEGGDTALVIMETHLEMTGSDGSATSSIRQATYVFRRSVDGKWLCVVDNSYGTDLLKDDLIV